MLPISRGRFALAGAFVLAFPLSSFMGAARAQVQLAVLGDGCGTAPTTHTSLSGMNYTSAPTNAHDPRLGQPQFYRDEGDNAWWTHASTPGTH